jgi:hypothetical protein
LPPAKHGAIITKRHHPQVLVENQFGQFLKPSDLNESYDTVRLQVV